MDLKKLAEQAQAFQQQIQEMQANLGNQTYQGKAGGGLVTLTISGKTEMKKIEIDSSLLKIEEKEILEDLIVAAFTDAKEKADRSSQDSMKNAMGNMGLPPGMKLPF